MTPDSPIRTLKGAGDARAKALEEQGPTTVNDLLWFFPFRYEDRRHPTRIADLGQHVDSPVLIRGRVISSGARVSPVKRMKIFEAVIEDGSGAVKLVWFNQGFLADQIGRGDKLSVFGAPRISNYGKLQVESPDWEKFEGDEEDEGAIVPVYSKVATIPPKAFRRLVGQALEVLPTLPDPLPAEIRKELRVIGLAEALEELHRPMELTGQFLGARSPAHLRVILQEFFTFQLAMRLRRVHDEVRRKERTIVINDALRDEIRRILPFRLTAAQKRVMREIVDDLRGEQPM
ncbi:MAG: OB-fold nucleic acid binding domain-containing protein, partial [Thermoanaerobaculia bacterium]